MECRYTKALEINFFEILPSHQCLINDADSNIESFRPHLKLIVEFSKPVYKILPILIWNFALKVFILQEIPWIEMLFLFFPYVFNNLRNKLNNSLRISYLEHIIQVQLGLVFLEPIFAARFHLLHNCLQLGLIEFGEAVWFLLWLLEHWQRFRFLGDQTCWRQNLLNQLVNNHGTLPVIIAFHQHWLPIFLLLLILWVLNTHSALTFAHTWLLEWGKSTLRWVVHFDILRSTWSLSALLLWNLGSLLRIKVAVWISNGLHHWWHGLSWYGFVVLNWDWFCLRAFVWCSQLIFLIFRWELGHGTIACSARL